MIRGIHRNDSFSENFEKRLIFHSENHRSGRHRCSDFW